MEEINLIELIGKDIVKTKGTRKLTIKGGTEDYSVYKIPLDYLFYNDQNGRISTYVSKHTDEKGLLKLDNLEEYNSIVHNFIADSNPQALKKTKQNIKSFGQRLPGVALENGRIIDGNRRFTCLRELAEEEGKDYYFEAVILNTERGFSSKDVKRLELNLQHGEEKPVDYNPIDNLVDVYKDLVENETFTVKEYAISTDQKESEVKKLKQKSILLVEFLGFINAGGKYHIARDLNLDGPLQEVMQIVKRIKNEEKKEDVKNAMFAALITSEKGDLTRRIREIGKEIISKDNEEHFLEEYEEIVETIHDTLQEETVAGMSIIREKIDEKKEIKEKSNKIIENKIEESRFQTARNKPVDLLEKSFKQLDSIDFEAASKMSGENKKEFLELLENLKEKADVLGEKVDV